MKIELEVEMGKYYVYVGPGHIKYFEDINSAREDAEFYECKVRETSTDDILFDFE